MQEIIGELKQLNVRGTYVFVKGEVALLESVDECCGNIKGMLGEGRGLDLLYMSQGYLSFGGRNGELLFFLLLCADRCWGCLRWMGLWDDMADGEQYRDEGRD